MTQEPSPCFLTDNNQRTALYGNQAFHAYKFIAHSQRKSIFQFGVVKFVFQTLFTNAHRAVRMSKYRNHARRTRGKSDRTIVTAVITVVLS